MRLVFDDDSPVESSGVRARIRAVGPGVAKAERPSWRQLCANRAKAIYAASVQVSGGYLPSARREQCDESTVRDRCHDPRRKVHLDHVLAGLDRDGLYKLADLICDFADEVERTRVA